MMMMMMMMAGNLQEDVCACFAVMPLSGIRHPHAMRMIIIMIAKNMMIATMTMLVKISAISDLARKVNLEHMEGPERRSKASKEGTEWPVG